MPEVPFPFIHRHAAADLESADVARAGKRVAGVLGRFLAADAFALAQPQHRDPRQKIPSRETTAARRRRLLNETTSRAGT